MNPFKQERINFARFHKNAERQILPMVRKAQAKNIAGVLAWVEINGVDAVPVDALIDMSVWRDLYPRIFSLIGMRSARLEFYNQRNLDGIESKASAIEFLIDVWSGKLRDYALTYICGIERSLNETTSRIIKEALGETGTFELDRTGKIRWFYDKVKQLFKSRTTTMARTETTRIANLGKDIGARSWIDEQGVGGYKLWLGRVQDERPTHIAVNDTVIELEDKFTVGAGQADRPGDTALPLAEQINCRCTVSYMTKNRYDQYVKRGRIQNGKVTGAS